MNPTSADETIVKEISIDAPAERIFAALTEPNQRLTWWGGDYFKGEHMESDLRLGGKWMMRGTAWGDKPFEVSGEYRVIERPSALAFTWLPSWPGDGAESLVRFDLEETAGITLVRVTHSGLTSENARNHRGWPEILAWLQAFVERAG
ncbi:MAG TPA: SRPBCC domain-containing protein [Candidatus Aquilonibacter sp.]